MCALHVLVAWLAYRTLAEQRIWLLAVEVGLVGSLYLAYRLYRSFLRPVELMARGADAMTDEDFQVKFRPTGNRETDRLVRVYNQMMDRLREERTQTRAQHFFMKRLLDASPAAVLLLDYDGHLHYANPRATTLLRLTDAQFGRSLADLAHPLLQRAALLAAGERQLVSTDDHRRFRIERGAFVDRGFQRDFLSIEDLSNEILSAEKRAYGKVIRMMAHEVNNTLGAVNSLLQTGADVQRGSTDADVREFAEVLDVARARNERLTAFIRRFADVIRLPAPHPQPVELLDFLQRFARLMRPAATARNVALELELPERPRTALFDVQQLEQVLVNVTKNALEAIGTHGTVTVRLTYAPLLLRVLDDGPGLPDDFAERTATPFYSDKAHGQGIGLTLTREILRGHGFDFGLRNRPDGQRGTEFWVRLDAPATGAPRADD